MKKVLMCAFLICFGVSVSGPAVATPPAPSYGTAVVDGLYGEWNLPADFFANMYRAGNPSHPLESKAYLRYDCATQTLYVLVLEEPNVIGVIVPAQQTSWVAIDRQNSKRVTENSGNDGSPPDFSWIGRSYDGNQSHVGGYEASFTFPPGSYEIIIHTEAFDGGSNQTSASTGFPNHGPALVIDCAVTGACCTPSGQCANTIPAYCLAPNVWHGEWTSCSPDLCPQSTGVCCAPDGSCTVTTESQCAYQWLGMGTQCSPNPCPPPLGACCYPDGSCTVTTQPACTGNWLGMGTTCTPNPCTQPAGACCYPDGSCAMITQADCTGQWLGYGSSCTPNDCSQPVGACCQPDGSCTITAQAACTGQWLGVGGNCAPNPCPQPVGACCLPDGSCLIATQVDCSGPWLGYETTCAPNPCMQPPGACCNPVTGDCTMTAESECVAPHIWLGPNASCTSENPCPQPVPTQKTTWGRIKVLYR